MVYILLNIDSRAIYDVVFLSEASALAAEAQLGVSWVIVERQLEQGADEAPAVVQEATTPLTEADEG